MKAAAKILQPLSINIFQLYGRKDGRKLRRLIDKQNGL
jgi:hypothetical protein